MPPASAPMASMRWARSRSPSSRIWSVMSRVTASMLATSPGRSGS